MERLPAYAIEVFLSVVREGSMRAAAQSLGVGAPAVTLQLKSLEEQLGVELLFRTTRNIEMTEAGMVLFDAAAPAHRDLTYAVKKTREMAKSTTPPIKSTFFAASSYLKSHGTPKRPRDLLGHRCIRQTQPATGNMREWRVLEDRQDKTIDTPARLIFDSAAGVIQAACDGHGIGWAMRVSVEEYLKAGRLKALLEPYTQDLPPYYIYYPEQNKRVECLKLLTEFLRSKLKARVKS